MRLQHRMVSWVAPALFAVISLSAGCTTRNPDICCDTADQCTHAGLDPAAGLAPCADGVCVNYTCVATGCDDDLDCHDPAHPTCVSGQCYGAVDACREGGGARIIFFSYRDGGGGLYSMYVNGSGQKPVTDAAIQLSRIGNMNILEPAVSVSSDGDVIAFAGGYDSQTSEIYTVGSDGTGLTKITDGADRLVQVEWSPDKMKLVASTQSAVAGKAMVMRADGSHPLPLTGYSVSNYDPSWSPDSTQIVFASNNGNDESGVWTAADNATSPVVFDSIPAFGPPHAYRPRWSPDGTSIGYLSDESGGVVLVLKKTDGNAGHVAPGAGLTTDFRWSHDGAHLLVTRQNGSPPVRTIWLMDADGSNQRQLTDAATDSGNARWSPDDQQILFDTRRDGDAEIYKMNADGTQPVDLTNAHGQDDAHIDDFSAEWASCPSS